MKSKILASISFLVILLFISGCTNINSTSDLKESGVTTTKTQTDKTSLSNSNNQNTTKTNNQNTPPNEAIVACSGKAINDACQFKMREETLTGVCNDKPGVLACAPNRDGNTQTQTKTNTTTTQPKSLTSTNSTTQPKNTASNGISDGSQSGYNIEQAISDKAQLNTLAFGGLGFLTGNLCSDSFLPPGKVADFFGFQYLRDVTQSGKGHSTDFVTNAANNVLYTLNDAQKAKMLALAKIQTTQVNNFAYMRYPLMTAFRRQLTGDIPTGKTTLSKSAVMAYSSNLYELDANISIARAKLFAEIINSLTTTQKAYLDNMGEVGFAGWEALPDQLDKRTMTHDENVLMMTYASEMFAWYVGDIEADTYFCPERQGDYFGGFYIKDAPAIGNAGYTIDESITGDAGEGFIQTLDATQKPIITNIVDTQRTAINGIVDKRRTISTELRKARSSETIDESYVRTLAREYGAYDGEISYYYATAFSKVGETLTTAQKEKMIELKNIEGYICEDTKIYLYSEKITKPTIQNTDFLFE